MCQTSAGSHPVVCAVVCAEGQLSHLQDLGFRKDDCKRALMLCKGERTPPLLFIPSGVGQNLTMPLSGQLDQAATWLLENAENIAGHPRAGADSGSGSHSAPLSGVEVKAESVCICFIDDCLDCDIPLAELTFSSKCVLSDTWRVLRVAHTWPCCGCCRRALRAAAHRLHAGRQRQLHSVRRLLQPRVVR